MAAVRVPPSACRTSQSMAMLFSPRAPRSIEARNDRPMSRLISWVRPPILPLTDSRSLRVWVARGSIEYSAVTQPRPDPRRQRGTPSVTLAAHRTRVRPNSTSTEPSAWSSQLRLMVTGRSWSAARPSGRVTPQERKDRVRSPGAGAGGPRRDGPNELDETGKMARDRGTPRLDAGLPRWEPAARDVIAHAIGAACGPDRRCPRGRGPDRRVRRLREGG